MTALVKDESVWPIAFRLKAEETFVGRWSSVSWAVGELNLYDADRQVELADTASGFLLPLALYRDERTDYRFNLSSRNPHLFVVCAEDNEQLSPVLLTAAQSVAGRYMDGEHQVLHVPLPLPVQAWMEAFIGRHGEQIEVKRKKGKGKKQRGRSSGN